MKHNVGALFLAILKCTRDTVKKKKVKRMCFNILQVNFEKTSQLQKQLQYIH